MKMVDIRDYVGKIIKKCEFKESDEIKLIFLDNTYLRVTDSPNLCCEIRYFTCDDDFQHLEGSVFYGFEVKEGPTEYDYYGEHEIKFLELQTSSGFATFAAHNEHNGYYSGINIRLGGGLHFD